MKRCFQRNPCKERDEICLPLYAPLQTHIHNQYLENISLGTLTSNLKVLWQETNQDGYHWENAKELDSSHVAVTLRSLIQQVSVHTKLMSRQCNLPNMRIRGRFQDLPRKCTRKQTWPLLSSETIVAIHSTALEQDKCRQ